MWTCHKSYVKIEKNETSLAKYLSFKRSEE